MSIILNNGVQNINGTPGIITGDFTTAPAATTVTNGTLFVDYIGQAIYTAQSGSWYNLTAGSGTPTLQNVLDTGNIADDVDIVLRDLIAGIVNQMNGSSLALTLSPNVRSTLYYDFLEILDYSTTLRQVSLYSNKLRWIETTGGIRQDLLPNTTFAGQTVYLPESNGTIALQDPPIQASINSTPFTPTGTYNRIYRVVAGASSIVLNPANWTDRKTVTFCGDVTYTFSATGGATLRGQAFINATGLIYVTYLSSANTFYISHI